jgi:DNA-binding NarL/FixJ family response regulator
VPSSITLVIAHPKELIRSGLRAMLAQSSVKIAGEATNAANTLSLVKKHRPTVLLMDAAIPGVTDPFALLGKIAKLSPATKCVLLSAVDNPTYMARAKAAGVLDFLLESVTKSHLVSTVQQAAAGKPATAETAFARIAASMDDAFRTVRSGPKLTPRESQVLSHISYGLSNEEIAQSLGIGKETVKEHVQKILRKLAVKDRTQAAVWAVKGGMA